MQLMDWFSLSPSAATRSVSLMDRILQRSAKPYLPEWAQEWLEVIVPGLQILLILLVAMLLQYLLRRFVSRINQRYHLPRELLVPLKGILRWTIVASALLLCSNAWACPPTCGGVPSPALLQSGRWPSLPPGACCRTCSARF